MKLKGIISFFTQPVTVFVDWDEVCTFHRAKNYAEALEWASCYPLDAVVKISGRFGQALAYRW